MLIYSFIADYQAFSLRYKDNTTRDKNETKVGKQSANLGKNNEPIQNRLSFLIDCKSVILHHLTILSFPMVRPAWDNWWFVLYLGLLFGLSIWLNDIDSEIVGGVYVGLIIGTVPAMFSVLVRRFHDVGLSTWSCIKRLLQIAGLSFWGIYYLQY